MPRIRKKTSKRGTTNKRHRIKHKVSESHKKQKREAKKNPQWKSKHKKDPGIPNNYPFKDQVLAEAAEAKRQAEEERQKRKEQKAAAKAAAKLGGDQGEKAQAPVESAEDDEEHDSTPLLRDSDLPTLKEVLEQADVVLQVLDARDPLPFRSKWIEDSVKSDSRKRLAFVLNKIDLVPRESAARWKTYLRTEAATTLFRASSRVLDSNVAPTSRKPKNESDTPAIGVDALKDVLGSWASEKQGDGPLRVAFIGMVNSGKSTIINALSGTNSVPVYSRSRPGAGFATTPYPTKVAVEIEGKAVELIDTPGLMKQNGSDQPQDIRVRDMLFRNKGKVDKVKDPLPAIQHIVSRSSAEDLMVLYSLPAFPDKDANGFLKAFARSKGFVQKKGDIDLINAAKHLLKDWTSYRFPFYTLPVEQPSSPQTELNKVLEEIYKKYDPSALESLRTKASLWASSGLVKFDPAEIDTREVVLTAVSGTEKEAGLEDEEEEESDEGSQDGEEEDSEGSAILSDDEEEEEEPVSSAKRKRKEQPELVERNVKSKKVAFAREPSKPSKSSQPKQKATQPTKKAPKVANAKKGNAIVPATGGDGAYDFSKFF